MAWNNFPGTYMPNVPGQFNPASYMQTMSQYPSQMGQFNAQMGAQQQSNGLIRVTGMDGAKAFQMPANSVVALFDDGSDVFYVKSTDGAGFPTIRVFDFSERKSDQMQSAQTASYENYATKQELQMVQQQLEQVKGLIENGKHSVPDKQSTSDQPARSSK